MSSADVDCGKLILLLGSAPFADMDPVSRSPSRTFEKKSLLLIVEAWAKVLAVLLGQPLNPLHMIHEQQISKSSVTPP